MSFRISFWKTNRIDKALVLNGNVIFRGSQFWIRKIANVSLPSNPEAGGRSASGAFQQMQGGLPASIMLAIYEVDP